MESGSVAYCGGCSYMTNVVDVVLDPLVGLVAFQHYFPLQLRLQLKVLTVTF